MDAYEMEILREVLQVLGPILAIYGAIFLVIGIAGLASYILRGLAIFNMSKARGFEYGWLGFIPYARDYQLGQIAGEIEFGNKKIKNTGVWLVLAPILYNVVVSVGAAIMLVPYFMTIFSLSYDPSPEEIMGPIVVLLISMFVFIVIALVAQVLFYLVWFLAIHKIFSQYSTGQKPVFYLIIALFVPLGQDILLFMHSKRPMLAMEAGSGVQPVAVPGAGSGPEVVVGQEPAPVQPQVVAPVEE
jgi:hypothetical protein